MAERRHSFDGWTLDEGTLQLVAATGPVTLRPKTFEVLRYLVANAGRLVTREELLDAAWPGVTVTEESITQCVSELRQALGDQQQKIIKTVPRRGYIFTAAVDIESKADALADDAVQPSGGARPGESDTRRQQLAGTSVVVLPFANLSGDAGQEYLSDGFTEDIIAGLSTFSELSVIASNPSFS